MDLNLPFQFVSLATLAAASYGVKRRRVEALHGLGLATAGTLVAATVMGFGNPFAVMRLTAWFLFLHLPVFLCVYAWQHWAERRRSVVAICGAVALAAVAFVAFFLEPTRLEVSRHTLRVDGLRNPVRIVVLADIQTDQVGDYEREVFDTVTELDPDLVLLAGDYVQVYDSRRPAQKRRLRELMLTLDPPLGAWAVRGNVDPDDARDIFAGTKVAYFESTGTVQPNDEITLVGLSMEDSFDQTLRLPTTDRPLRLVLGHSPDYSLGTRDESSKDLFLAGHTHGGQVQLPLLGPLITFSSAPRAWGGGGLVQLSERRSLIVSRGIGMEREDAPRLRFLCRPEVVVIDVSATAR